MIVTEEEPDQKLKSGTPPDIATSFATAGEATIATKLDSVVESAKEESSTDAQVDIIEHNLSVEELAIKYGVDIDENNPSKSVGLTEIRATELQRIHGLNSISPPKKKNPFFKFLSYVCQIFNLLLLLAGICSFIIFIFDNNDKSNLYLGILLVAVCFMNATIEFYQAYKSAAILQSFLTLIPANCMVIRDGITREIPASELVAGDLVCVKLGQKSAADLRLIWASEDLKVDNSSITGESEPLLRSLRKGSNNPLEAENLIFNGSLIVSGEGIGLVIRTGDKSILGQIAGLTMSGSKRKSQLSAEINHFVKKIGIIASLFAIVSIVIGIARGFTVAVTFNCAIGILVAFIPQGLPTTVTILLTIAAKRLAHKNVLVKDLQGVETLGSITMLATDKTGTLTQNKMTTVGAWLNTVSYSIADNVDIGSNEKIFQNTLPNASLLVDICGLCSKSSFDDCPEEAKKPVAERRIFGDATESGLLRFCAVRTDVEALREANIKVHEIPFSSATKWHLTVHPIGQNTVPIVADVNANVETPIQTAFEAPVISEAESRPLLPKYRFYLKGAPERVVKMCNRYLKGTEAPMVTDMEFNIAFDNAYESFASQGQRVLAFAYLDADQALYDSTNGFKDYDPSTLKDFVFVGLLSLMDPPKRGVRKAVASCRTAGIQVVMVTGDHPLTAEAIARKIGIIQGITQIEAAKRLQKPFNQITENEYDAVVVHGDYIETLTSEDWDKIFSKREIVFARTTPHHKLAIVTKAQEKGHIVGVSGDGVNDSPALKKSDLGISMNKSASDVSKEAAAMILLDDDFASIVAGIREGRVIFSNLKKSIRYTLTHALPELVGFLMFVCLGMPLPTASIMILFIDLGTELGPALSYAWEPAERDIMLIPPRKVLCTGNVNWGTFRRNTEATVEQQHNWFRKLMSKVQVSFKKNETGEVLVDNEMLIWCFFQGGLIIAIGCVFSYLLSMTLDNVNWSDLINTAKIYFVSNANPLTLTNGKRANAEEQKLILASADAAYFLAIVIGQWFNLFIQKHRYSYPWGRDMFVNTKTYIGMAIGLVLATLIVYTPGLQTFFTSYNVKPLVLLVPIAAGIVLYVYEIIRRYLRIKGYFGGIPKKNQNLVELIRTTTTLH